MKKKNIFILKIILLCFSFAESNHNSEKLCFKNFSVWIYILKLGKPGELMFFYKITPDLSS